MNDKTPTYRFDDVRVEPQALRVTKAGRAVPLEPKAFEVLLYLLARRGRLVEKQELLDAVWKEAFVTPNAMTRVIAQLRKALGDDAHEPRYIETVPTRGYRFVAEVVEEQTQGEQRQPPPTEAARPAVSTRRRFISTRALTLAGIVGALVAAFLVWRWREQGSEAAWTMVVKTTQISSSPGLDIYPAFAPDGNSIAYSSDRSGGFEVYVKPLVTGGREVQVTSDGQQNIQAAWSPDGKMIAYHSRERGGVWLVPALGGVARQIADFGSRPAWSRDGKLIVFQSDEPADLSQTAFGALPPSTIWTVPAAGGAPKQVTRQGDPPGGHGSPSWIPNQARIFFVAYDFGQSEAWSIAPDGTDLRKHGGVPALIYDPVFAPDGRSVYVSARAGNFRLWQIRVAPDSCLPVGEPVLLANMGNVLPRHLSVSPDGKRLAYSSLSMNNNVGSVRISPATGEALGPPALLTQDTNYRKTTPLFSPDGKQVAYNLWRMGAEGEIWVMDADGGNPRQVTTEPAALVGWVRPSGRLAYFIKGLDTRQLWEVDWRSGERRLRAESRFPSGLGRLSPDGSRFALNVKSNQTLNVWVADVASGAMKQLTFDRELMGFPNWSDDGDWITFEVKRGRDTHVAVMPSEGGAHEQLTSERGQSWPSSFSPDNDKVTFAGLRDGVWNIWWVSRRDGTQRRVTNYARPNVYVRYPAWSPRGDQIVYEYAETAGNVWVMELK
jgi:Tol biopolymer transport system component/DNA-binding winged helix-turn-helix (wHTH) protein